MFGIIKKIFLYALLFGVFLTSNFFSQDLYFAQSYTTKGTAINAKTNWLIPSKGKSIFILFDAGELNLRGERVYLYIDKLVGDSYKSFETKSIVIPHDRNWFVHRVKFKEAGKYKIYVLNRNNNELVSDYLTIRVKAPRIKDEVKESLPYYRNVRMTFCEWVVGGKPFRELKVKYLSRKPDSVAIYLKHPDSLNTSRLYVKFYKENNFTKNWELFDTKEYAILPMWDYVFFKYFFNQSGLYKVEIYNENDEFIKSAYLKVEENE